MTKSLKNLTVGGAGQFSGLTVNGAMV